VNELVAVLAANRLWLIGIAVDIAGSVMQAFALHFGALALVQPILVLDLLPADVPATEHRLRLRRDLRDHGVPAQGANADHRPGIQPALATSALPPPSAPQTQHPTPPPSRTIQTFCTTHTTCTIHITCTTPSPA